LAQQILVSGLKGGDGSAVASLMEADSVEVTEKGPTLAEITCVGRIRNPGNASVLAKFRQRIRLWAGRPTAEIHIAFEDVNPLWLEGLPKVDPWASHLAVRWAWADANATLRRTSFLRGSATESQRPETPDAIEISSRNLRTTLVFGGLAHHQRHGGRMLDTLLIAGAETAREFRFGVTLDREHAFHAASDFVSPVAVVPTENGPPKAGPVGWLLMVDNPALQVARLEFLPNVGDSGGWGLAATIVETAGKGVRARLRLFRDPLEARQTDFSGELLYDMATEGDAVHLDLTPYEMMRVEIRLGVVPEFKQEATD
jgi:alpha-mannosidase